MAKLSRLGSALPCLLAQPPIVLIGLDRLGPLAQPLIAFA